MRHGAVARRFSGDVVAAAVGMPMVVVGLAVLVVVVVVVVVAVVALVPEVVVVMIWVWGDNTHRPCRQRCRCGRSCRRGGPRVRQRRVSSYRRHWTNTSHLP